MYFNTVNIMDRGSENDRTLAQSRLVRKRKEYENHVKKELESSSSIVPKLQQSDDISRTNISSFHPRKSQSSRNRHSELVTKDLPSSSVITLHSKHSNCAYRQNVSASNKKNIDISSKYHETCANKNLPSSLVGNLQSKQENFANRRNAPVIIKEDNKIRKRKHSETLVQNPSSSSVVNQQSKKNISPLVSNSSDILRKKQSDLVSNQLLKPTNGEAKKCNKRNDAGDDEGDVDFLSRKRLDSYSSCEVQSIKCPKINITERVKLRVKEDKKFQERVHLLNMGSCSSSNSSNESNTKISKHETMDWEPLEPCIVIQQINLMRKSVTNQPELASDIALCSVKVDEGGNLNGGKLILVFDTNIFISSLTFILEVRDTFFPDHGLPYIFIPWRVLQELDKLKVSDNTQIQYNARRAINFINENFTSKHPRVSGQSYEDFSSMIKQKSCADDEILQVCLNLKKVQNCKRLVFITDDKNLESKAVVSNIETSTRERFLKELVANCNTGTSCYSIQEKLQTRLKNDVLLCRLKQLLNNFFRQFLEVELKNIYGDVWTKILWSLSDLIDCMVHNWKSVFSLIFRKNVLLLLKELKSCLEKAEKGNESQVLEAIKISRNLLISFTRAKDKNKRCTTLLDETTSEIELLILSENKTQEKVLKEEKDILQMLLPPSLPESESTNVCSEVSSVIDSKLCNESVRSLFSIIWNHIRDFCLRVMELANMTVTDNNYPALNEIKCQVPHVMKIIQELINNAENILNVSAEKINDGKELVLNFAQFLVQLNVVQLNPTELSNLPVYLYIFCGDNDGRSILATFVNEVKLFAVEIMKGIATLGLL